MNKFFKLTAVLTLALSCSTALAMDNFNEAKRLLPGIYRQLDEPKTLYCGCKLTFNKNRYYPDLKSCGYKARKNAKRAARIEAEHVMPAWDFGHQMQCWKDGKREQCAGSDQTYKRMEGDLHNLFPAVGEVNGDRSNYQFTNWNGTADQYGQCQMVIDFKGKQAQPPQESRGIIARAYLYMSKQYGVRLSHAQERLYKAWNNIYPPEKDECRRNEIIQGVQGNYNEFISAKCNNEVQQRSEPAAKTPTADLPLKHAVN